MKPPNYLQKLKKNCKQRARGGSAKKGPKHISTHIQQMLEDENFEQKLKDGTVLKGRPLEAILKVAIAKARTGDHKFMDLLFKYGYTQKVDITSGGEPIKALVEFVDADNTDKAS